MPDTGSNPLTLLLASKGVLLADGATGTTLFDMGLTSGDSPEIWNAEKPEKITKLHQGFVDAGSDIILTNSFGGTRHRLKLHDAQDRVHELNRLAGEIARHVADSADRPIIVAGSVGPTGELLEPLGSLTYDAAVDAFTEQMEGLKAGGVDILWIETMSSADEMRAAGQAASNVAMPYVVTASFDTAGKTMMGLSPRDFHQVFEDTNLQPLAIGANCGVGASDLLSAILDMSEANPNAILVAKANCGIPVVKGEKVEYTGTPELMSQYACLAIDAGSKIIGGCCGTSCNHIAAMRRAIDTHKIGERPELNTIIERIGPMINATAAANDSQPRRERRNRKRANII
jgi:5-methyltetrahydrofolate--homocysteine methyltransferase